MEADSTGHVLSPRTSRLHHDHVRKVRPETVCDEGDTRPTQSSSWSSPLRSLYVSGSGPVDGKGKLRCRTLRSVSKDTGVTRGSPPTSYTPFSGRDGRGCRRGRRSDGVVP